MGSYYVLIEYTTRKCFIVNTYSDLVNIFIDLDLGYIREENFPKDTLEYEHCGLYSITKINLTNNSNVLLRVINDTNNDLLQMSNKDAWSYILLKLSKLISGFDIKDSISISEELVNEDCVIDTIKHVITVTSQPKIKFEIYTFY